VGESSPAAPGYRTRDHVPNWLSVARVFVTACVVIVSCDLLVFRWPLAFTSADVMPLSRVITFAAVGGLAAGTCIGIGTRRSAQVRLAAAYILAALSIQIGPWLLWLAFDGWLAYRAILLSVPVVCGCLLGCLSVWMGQYAVDSLAPSGLLRALVSPLWLTLTAVLFLALASISTWTSLLTHGTLLGAVYLCSAVASSLTKRPALQARRSNRVILALCVPVLLVTIANGVLGNRCIPQAVARTPNQTAVYFQRGRIYELRVTSGQDAFHVFIGNRLRFSTIDQNRWANALTQPALARLRCPKRALVFSLGEGLAERELLRQPCIDSITSVVRDRVAVNAARRQPWWRLIIADAWNSPRVHVDESDPAVWLTQAGSERFDLAIVDLPDPDNFVDAKYFTRYFYREIGKHLTESAIVVVQATSALRSPKTFASIHATLDAAGYNTLAYRTAMTTLGEWYFLLASHGPFQNESADWRVSAASMQSFVIPPDALPTQAGRVSRLDDPAAMDAFLEESGDEVL
jgi:predicted membrane-bound spermidine synthase